MRIRVQEHGNWLKFTINLVFCLSKRLFCTVPSYVCFWPLQSFSCKNSTFHDLKDGPRSRFGSGLVFWIRIRIRIRTEANADPQHLFIVFGFRLICKVGSTALERRNTTYKKEDESRQHLLKAVPGLIYHPRYRISQKFATSGTGSGSDIQLRFHILTLNCEYKEKFVGNIKEDLDQKVHILCIKHS